MQRGEVWWASLSAPTRPEPGYRRPVLVVQDDEFNASKIGTVIVVALTSNMALAVAPGNVSLSRRETGLPRRSVADVSQLLTLDKSVLTERCGKIGRTAMRDLENGIRLVLSL
jgi:mRNA interferase MazF